MGRHIRFRYDLLEYAMCIPMNECWVLSLLYTAMNESGNYTVCLDGEKIIHDGELTRAEVTHEICVSRESEYCTDPGGKFKYKQKNKMDKRIGCKGVGDEKGRKRKKICRSGCDGSICRYVKQRCLESCGKVSQGVCKFLKEYGPEPPSPAPGTVIFLDGKVVD